MQNVERKVLSILTILSDSQETMGARLIARQLHNLGIELGERAVRYHLKLMDERGLTRLVGRDGRLITDLGIEELKSATVKDKVGFVISRIDILVCRTDFDLNKHSGSIPVNISFFPKEKFKKALKVMKPVFKAGLCASDLVAVAHEGEAIGELVVPEGKVAFVIVSSIVIHGVLLSHGIPIDPKFAGILQMRSRRPLRFVEIIHYAGCSLSPVEVFMTAKMTSVLPAAKNGQGRILATFREIPSVRRPMAEEVIAELKEARLGGLLLMGSASEPVCGIPVDLDRTGVVLIAGVNPIAAAWEAGIESEIRTMSDVAEYKSLVRFSEL